MKTLDIIVTHYMEPDYIVDRFLNSLNNQEFKDYEVTIVDDGFDCPSLDSVISKYSFKINVLKKEHKTVSASRNYGMDHTDAPYLMFCDCDDMFLDNNKGGLIRAFWRILHNDLCVYRSLIYIEAWEKNLNNQLSSLYKKDDDDRLITVTSRSINASNCHSKIYKRSFIKENNIRFDDDLWMNEDGVFNHEAYSIAREKNLRTLDDCDYFYVWKYNEKSVTRQNKIYPIKGYDQFIKAASYGFRRKLNSNSGFTQKDILELAEFMFQAYYWLYFYADRFVNDPEFNECMKNDIKAATSFNKEFRQYINKEACNSKEFKNYVNTYMKKLDKCDLSKKTMSFEEWFDYIAKENI